MKQEDAIQEVHLQRTYHIVFSTFYRRAVLLDDKRVCIEEIILQICADKRIYIEVFSVLSDHVHIVLHKSIGQSLPVILQAIKGISTYYFFEEFPELKIEMGKSRLWTRGYNETLIKTIKQYEATVRYVNYNYDKHLDTWVQGISLSSGGPGFTPVADSIKDGTSPTGITPGAPSKNNKYHQPYRIYV